MPEHVVDWLRSSWGFRILTVLRRGCIRPRSSSGRQRRQRPVDRWKARRNLLERGGLPLTCSLSSEGSTNLGTQIAISVDDIDNAHAVAVRAGAQVLHEPALGILGPKRTLQGPRRQRD